MLHQIRGVVGPEYLGTSAIVLTELLRGAHRGMPDAQRIRQQFIAEMRRDIPVLDYSVEMAELAGRIGGQQGALGQTIPPIDLMIGVTALYLNFSLLTANVRRFRMIPGLTVIPF